MINKGLIQPQSKELEDAIIGAIILESECFDLVSGILKPEYFYSENNGLIFKACLNLVISNTPIDLLTIAQELKRNGQLENVGGMYAISMLTNNIASANNIEAHSAIVIQKYLLREMIILGSTMIKKACQDETDCFDLIEFSANSITNILNVIENKKSKRLDELSNEVLEDCFTSLTTDKPTGVPISINLLQSQTNGWRKGNLVILAARPAMGKTAVALDYAYFPASQGIPVAFFSLEMTGKELAGRLMSKESHISSQKINNNLVDTDELTALRKDCLVFNNLPLYIDDTPSLTLTRLRSKALRMKREHNIQLLIIDYLQLMSGSSEKDNREQEISKLSRGLKNLAKELDIPVIALSQLSRQVENRPGGSKKPQLSDLRDSGSIEQDADMVIFLMRPEYYGLETYLYGNDEIMTNGLILFIIAKFRGGITGDIRAKWIGETTSISNFIEDIEPTKYDEIPEGKSKLIELNTNFLNDKPFN
jgi:replicative DNA helicase